MSSSGGTSANPIAEFQAAARRAAERGIDPAPVALATADREGRPSVRIVLLRGADQRGFVFHTNYTSRKARELAENPHAAICVHWHALEEQIRIEGTVERLDGAESDAYFASRPRGSQLGAWASRQSAPLAARETLEREYRALEQRFAGGDVPRPPFWGGFRLIPARIEFWFGRADRLHERVLYVREGQGWTTTVLYP
jgi:pyridoxamine 5'-phosphate oxidase